MSNWTIDLREEDEVPIFSVGGHFTGETGESLTEKVKEVLRQGKIGVVLDFSNCKALHNLGTATLLDLAFLVVEDARGCLAVCNLDPLATSNLVLSQILPLASLAPNLEEAVAQCRRKTK